MENKINIADLLRNCPQGMELDCTMYDRVTFDEVTTVIGFDDKKRVKIILSTHYSDGTKDEIILTEFGTYTDDETAKCVIFPKGKTTWKGFTPPCQFKDGDIIFTHTNASKGLLEYSWISIFKEYRNNRCACYVCLCLSDLELDYDKWEDVLLCELCEIEESRLATEKEKEKFFKAIKNNGYKWNAETKTLEKLTEPKFHEGQWITDGHVGGQITSIEDNYPCYKIADFMGGINTSIPFTLQDNYHLWTIQDAKDGDVLAAHECLVLFKKLDGLNIKCYCTYHFMNNPSFYVDTLQNKTAFHPATEEEKRKLFDAIKANGYHWNAETKTLEKLPKFKVGNRIKYKNGKNIDGVEQGIILSITDDTYDVAVTNNMGIFVPIADQDKWELVIEPIFKVGNKIKDTRNNSEGIILKITDEGYECHFEFGNFLVSFKEQHHFKLVPSKFDITTLKPFESRVLVRNVNGDLWKPAIYGFSHSKGCYVVGGAYWGQCIPYDVNKELLGTTNNAEDYGSR